MIGTSDNMLTNGLVHWSGPAGFLATIFAAGAGISSDSWLLLAAAVVFAIATWRSRAPGILRADNEALALRIKTLEKDGERVAAALVKAEAERERLRAQDAEAVFTLLAAHDKWEREMWERLAPALEAIAWHVRGSN